MTTVLLLCVLLAGLIGGLCLYGSFSIRSSLYGKIHWHGRTDKHQIAITFDDGPHPQFTREILKILQRENVPATFFLVGKKVEAFPGVAREVLEAGHDLGFHGYTHRPLWMKSRGTLWEEVEKSREAFRRVLGFEPKLFRPPYGIRGRRIMRIARQNGWKTIYWTRAGWDWTEISAEEVARRALKNPKAGNILLLHDSNGPALEADRRRTVEALGKIIRSLREQGFSFARVSEMLPD
jgi:peptidoglycan/xylan/chitin deacetylase (PgdA/CDA1 family)